MTGGDPHTPQIRIRRHGAQMKIGNRFLEKQPGHSEFSKTAKVLGFDVDWKVRLSASLG